MSCIPFFEARFFNPNEGQVALILAAEARGQ